MAMFTANFDASGHPHDPSPHAAFFVSGFVSTAGKWTLFEEQWLALLAEFRIESPFHMTDFEAGEKQYASWKDDRPRRETFLLRAVDIIHKQTNKPFSQGVLLADIRRMFKEYNVTNIDDLENAPYPWCALQVMRATAEWSARRLAAGTVKETDRLEIIFELGDLHRGKFMQAAEEAYGYVPIFKKKSEWVPFQICDILAWEHRHRYSQFARYGGGLTRASYEALARRLPQDALRFNSWESIERACRQAGFTRRG